jgi:hypothetical protein
MSLKWFLIDYAAESTGLKPGVNETLWHFHTFEAKPIREPYPKFLRISTTHRSLFSSLYS